MAKVLVTGGAGYIGSSTCAWLIDQGHDVWVLDDLSTGHLEHVLGRGFTFARLGDTETVTALLKREHFDCVMHFAAKALVSESVAQPAMYYENNVDQTRLLLEAMLSIENPPCFIFSSTCAIFGDPGADVIDESMVKKPVNPYGQTKLEVEKILEQFAKDRGLKSIALRYFNAAGTEPKLRVGEVHEPETHLIPNILKASREGRPVQLFGTDYPTLDGTCVRDYIHVSDLAAAHESAMMRLLKLPGGGRFEGYNLGSEDGISVRQMVEACSHVLEKDIPILERPRRPGDPPILVADSSLAKKRLGFETQFSLGDIIDSAWQWERKRRQPKPVVFLDRDGTINEDPGYLSQPEQMKLLPGVPEALVKLKRAGFLLIVVSNQSGVGRGIIEPQNLIKIHEKLDELLGAHGVKIDHYELCIHKPEDGCECRKPKSQLLTEGARKLNGDLSRSVMVGDKVSDIEAGRAAACASSVLVLTGHGQNARKELPAGATSFIAADLAEAADWIIRNHR